MVSSPQRSLLGASIIAGAAVALAFASVGWGAPLVASTNVGSEPSFERVPSASVSAASVKTSSHTDWAFAVQREVAWVYPVSAVDRYKPNKVGAFGARRSGRRPSECGRGHCGVDVLGQRGQPIVSVLPGEIIHVDNRRWRRAGKYVRIRHANGDVTSYMHLDRIRRDLKKGMRVRAGEQIGTLGRTGVRRSPAHLHMSLRKADAHRGHYVDPAPHLLRARILAAPVARRL